jgi:chromosome segregation ATPase
MTFQEQCMKTVFPRFIEGINAANRKVEALTSEVAQLQAKAQELEVQLLDAIDRVNALEAKAAEKKTRKPRAKKQADPVAMVEQAAQDAQASVVETVEQAMNELPF